MDNYHHFHLQNAMGHQMNHPMNHLPPNYNYQPVHNIQTMTHMHRNMGYMPHMNPIYQNNINGFQSNTSNVQNIPNVQTIQNSQSQHNYHSF